MAPDGPDQWDIQKWWYWVGRNGVFPSVLAAWTLDNMKAMPYATQEEADAVAFGITLMDHTLMSKIHVWRFEQPVEEFAGLKPWRRADG